MDTRSAIYHYCNYQERSHYEVRNKLYELGCKTPEVEELIAEVIEKDLLNEERYARAYARGKFRMNKWGKSKIIQHFKLHKVSEYCIKKGLSEIDEDEYLETAQILADKKLKEYQKSKPYILRNKLYKYLFQRGFEYKIINIVLNNIFSEG